MRRRLASPFLFVFAAFAQCYGMVMVFCIAPLRGHGAAPTIDGTLLVARIAAVTASAIACIGFGCWLWEMLGGHACPRSFRQRLDEAPRPLAGVALRITAVPRFVLCAVTGIAVAPFVVVGRFVERLSSSDIEANYTGPIARLIQTFDGVILAGLGMVFLHGAMIRMDSGFAGSACILFCFSSLLIIGAVWGIVFGESGDPLRKEWSAPAKASEPAAR